MDTASIWTAAACVRNPGPGGYALLINTANGAPTQAHNGRRLTTPGRMELFAAIRALTALTEPHNVEIRTSDPGLVNAIANRDGGEHPDLWEHLQPQLEKHNVVAILHKKRNSKELEETYGLALRASQSHPDKPDTGYEATAEQTT